MIQQNKMSSKGLLTYRELGEVFLLIAVASEALTDSRTGDNIHHDLVGLLRQSVFSHLAGCEGPNRAAPGLRDTLIKIRPKIVRRAPYITLQMAGIAISRD